VSAGFGGRDLHTCRSGDRRLVLPEPLLNLEARNAVLSPLVLQPLLNTAASGSLKAAARSWRFTV